MVSCVRLEIGLFQLVLSIWQYPACAKPFFVDFALRSLSCLPVVCGFAAIFFYPDPAQAPVQSLQLMQVEREENER